MNNTKCLYTNGDSLVFGQELNPDRANIRDGFEFTDHKRTHCFTGLMQKHYGIENYINNSQPGSSNDRILRTTMLDVSKLLEVYAPQDLFVIIGTTYSTRKEFYNTDIDKYYQYQPEHNPGAQVRSIDPLWKIYTAFYLSEIEQIERYLIQVVSIQNFLKCNKVPYLITTSLSNSEEVRKLESDYQHLINTIDKKRFLNNESFEEFTIRNNLPIGKNWHPLEEGHAAWAEHLIKHINDNKLFYHD
jgi:hypothetical protein